MHTREVLRILSEEYPPHKEHFVQGGGDGAQEVGLAHSTEEASNDRGGKGLTYKLLSKQNISHTGGDNDNGKCVFRNSITGE